jgi:hypothetical protein
VIFQGTPLNKGVPFFFDYKPVKIFALLFCLDVIPYPEGVSLFFFLDKITYSVEVSLSFFVLTQKRSKKSQGETIGSARFSGPRTVVLWNWFRFMIKRTGLGKSAFRKW